MPKDDVLFPTECMIANGQLDFIVSLALAKTVTLITIENHSKKSGTWNSKVTR